MRAKKKPVREYLKQDKFFYVPEIYDCISTRAAEMNGFEMVMISSSDFACSYTGIPDLDLLSVDEYVSLIDRITNMTDMPLFVDADEGFGRPLQTFHACRRMAKAGADGVLISDRKPLGNPGVLPVKEARHRFRAAKEGLENSDCLLMASVLQDFDEDFDGFVDRCNQYLEEGVDVLLPMEVNRSKKYGGKLGAALKIGDSIDATFWYPDLDPGDKPEDAAELLKRGYRFTGIHYSFRAAMYAMLDTGRHVFEEKTNDYVMTHYDYTGYHFYYSPMTCFLSDGEWMERERRYTDDPENALAVRKHKGFCGPTDRLDPNKK